eukprot:6334590-Amphidinium_carterae.1
MGANTGKNRSQHHEREVITKQIITHIDHRFLKSDNDKQNSTVLTICESTTGLGCAMVVPYKGNNAETLETITRFIVENGLQTTILQSDGEPAILEILTELGRQLPR